MRKLWWLIILAAILAATAGCACNETGMERGYGDSYKMEIANQTLHPEAAQNLAPVTGMAAPAASRFMRATSRASRNRPDRRRLTSSPSAPREARSTRDNEQ